MRELVYKIFGEPIAAEKGLRGTNSGKLYIDKKVFFQRADVRATISKMKSSTVLVSK